MEYQIFSNLRRALQDSASNTDGSNNSMLANAVRSFCTDDDGILNENAKTKANLKFCECTGSTKSISVDNNGMRYVVPNRCLSTRCSAGSSTESFIAQHKTHQCPNYTSINCTQIQEINNSLSKDASKMFMSNVRNVSQTLDCHVDKSDQSVDNDQNNDENNDQKSNNGKKTETYNSDKDGPSKDYSSSDDKTDDTDSGSKSTDNGLLSGFKLIKPLLSGELKNKSDKKKAIIALIFLIIVVNVMIAIIYTYVNSHNKSKKVAKYGQGENDQNQILV